jgi:hypothetical protein
MSAIEIGCGALRSLRVVLAERYFFYRVFTLSVSSAISLSFTPSLLFIAFSSFSLSLSFSVTYTIDSSAVLSRRRNSSFDYFRTSQQQFSVGRAV